jgi:DNA-binding transcriptional LysR family regulator
VRLTEAGRALVKHADAILARLSDAEAELEAIAGLRGGRLRLVSFPTAAATVMPRAISVFRERHPFVELSLEPAEPPEALEKLRAGECDIALTIDAPFAEGEAEGVDKVHLLDDPMYVALPIAHPLAQASEVRLEQLASDPWIGGLGGGHPDALIVLRACHAAGFEPRIAFHSDDYLAIQGFIAAGMGVSLIPDLALLATRDDVAIRSVAGSAPFRTVQAATMRGVYRSPAVDAMLSVLLDVCSEFAAQRRELALAS